MSEVLSFASTGWGTQPLVGLLVTLGLAVPAFLLGSLLGTLAATVRHRGHALSAGTIAVYTTLVRGLPELLVIYLIFFGGEQLLRSITSLVGYNRDFHPDPYVAGLLSLDSNLWRLHDRGHTRRVQGARCRADRSGACIWMDENRRVLADRGSPARSDRSPGSRQRLAGHAQGYRPGVGHWAHGAHAGRHGSNGLDRSTVLLLWGGDGPISRRAPPRPV